MNYDPYTWLNLADVKKSLSTRLRALRLAAGWKQTTLAEHSGVTVASLRRFESTGEISLTNLLKMAWALGRLEEFDKLFKPMEVTSIRELEERASRPVRKRGNQ